jgi:hypothetical protein
MMIDIAGSRLLLGGIFEPGRGILQKKKNPKDQKTRINMILKSMDIA